MYIYICIYMCRWIDIIWSGHEGIYRWIDVIWSGHEGVPEDRGRGSPGHWTGRMRAVASPALYRLCFLSVHLQLKEKLKDHLKSNFWVPDMTPDSGVRKTEKVCGVAA